LKAILSFGVPDSIVIFSIYAFEPLIVKNSFVAPTPFSFLAANLSKRESGYNAPKSSLTPTFERSFSSRIC